ncbi:MAG: VacJ family lipoprotein [Lentisphaeria bacterium]|jgi:phospholipid-binding lipoprotein MlaA|nr:VacJ family lipoprotein [Lentisphaeria bacterium]
MTGGNRLGFGFWRIAFLAAVVGSFGAGGQEAGLADEFEAEYADQVMIADPLEPLNRVFYTVNDKLYFWLMKPLATGYEKIVPEPGRLGIRNMFDNVAMPKRFVNCLLQGKMKESGRELGRFGINSTVGILGWNDPAAERWEIKPQAEDTGQTLGVWGMDGMMSLTLPVFGPSNVRDTVGFVGDFFLDPLSYLPNLWVRAGLNAEKRVNNLSLALGEYEKTKDNALDHYLSLRNMYEQYRDRKIGE